MKLAIKNMVCNRCILMVTSIFEKHGFNLSSISLGEVILKEEKILEDKLKLIDLDLNEVGFVRIDDKNVQLIEKLKNSIIKKVHHTDFVDRKFNWSFVLSAELHCDYSYLSNLFSSMESITVEHYIINQKIERVKELLIYDELNTSEIADKLGYSSVQHLSSQFKKITGFTPSQFKKSHPIEHSRKSLDSI